MKKNNPNKSINKERRKLLSLASAAGAGMLLSPLLSKAAPSTIIEAGSNVDTASYIIFKDGNTIYAKNGMTGKIEFSGTDAATVIQNAINALISGGKIFIKNGTYTLTSGITFGGEGFYNPPNRATSIQGEEIYGTVLYNNSASVAVTLQGRFSSIGNLTIKGNNTNSGDGLQVRAYNDGGGGAFNNHIYNLNLINNNNGLVVSDAIYDCLFSNIRCVSNKANGILLISGGIDPGNAGNYYPNANSFVCITTTVNGNDGFRIEKGNTNAIYELNTENNRYGIYVNDLTTTIYTMYSENNVKGIYADTNSANLLICNAHNADTEPNAFLNGNYSIVNGSSIYSANSTLMTVNVNYLYLNWRLRTGEIATGQTRDFESWDASLSTPAYQSVFRMQAGYCDILRGRYVNMATPQITINGITSGTIIYSMPFRGESYKKFVAYLGGYRNSTATPQTITFPTAFTNIPKLVSDDSGGATVSTTTLILPNNMTSPKTGWIIVEGY